MEYGRMKGMTCAICHHVAKFRVDIHIVPINQPEVPEHQERILLCEVHIEDPGPAFGWDYKKAMEIVERTSRDLALEPLSKRRKT